MKFSVFFISLQFALITTSCLALSWNDEGGFVWSKNCSFGELSEDVLDVNNMQECVQDCKINECSHWVYVEQVDDESKKQEKKCYKYNDEINIDDANAEDPENIEDGKTLISNSCGFSPYFCNSLEMCKKNPVNQNKWVFSEKWLSASECVFPGKPFQILSENRIANSDINKESCGASCEERLECTHWVFRIIQNIKRCYLYSNEDIAVDNAFSVLNNQVTKTRCGFSNRKCPSKEECVP